VCHHQLFAKASKCQFGRSSVGFLGHVISDRGVAVDPQKVAPFAEWAQPASCTDVRQFVGLANFYCKFVCNFSGIGAHIGAAAPVLHVWDPARPTRLLTDASELAVSAILEQLVRAG
jgi:hypothetical protein